jgi:hypothetical protein
MSACPSLSPLLLSSPAFLSDPPPPQLHTHPSPPFLHTPQVGVEGPKTLKMPPDAPPLAIHLFERCTQIDPSARPTAAQVVELLRSQLAS